MLYRTIKACAISDYNHHQITITQSAPGDWCRQQELCVMVTLMLRGIGWPWDLLASYHPFRDGSSPYTHTHTYTVQYVQKEEERA